MKKIAIFGDSFADPKWVDPSKYNAWPELLAENYEVTNFSLSGSGMWWSYEKFLNLHKDFDYCIFVVTMPGRIYVESLDRHLNFNPITWPTWYGMNYGEVYFKHFYSQKREECFHNFMLGDILSHDNVLVIPAFIESMPNLATWSLCHLSDKEMEHYGLKHPGANEKRKCHLTKENNQVVYKKIVSAINNRENILTLTESDFVVPNDPMHFYWY